MLYLFTLTIFRFRKIALRAGRWCWQTARFGQGWLFKTAQLFLLLYLSVVTQVRKSVANSLNIGFQHKHTVTHRKILGINVFCITFIQ